MDDEKTSWLIRHFWKVVFFFYALVIIAIIRWC